MIDVYISEASKLKDSIGYDITNNKKPFYLRRDLSVIIETVEKTIEFIIPREYKWDGATIKCKLAQLIIGCPHKPEFVIPALLHDYLLDNKDIIHYNRKLSSDVLATTLIDFGVGELKVKIMTLVTDTYQKYFRRNEWKI